MQLCWGAWNSQMRDEKRNQINCWEGHRDKDAFGACTPCHLRLSFVPIGHRNSKVGSLFIIHPWRFEKKHDGRCGVGAFLTYILGQQLINGVVVKYDHLWVVHKGPILLPNLHTLSHYQPATTPPSTHTSCSFTCDLVRSFLHLVMPIKVFKSLYV